MAGIIERNANVSITIKTRSGISDGKPTWTSTNCTCMLFDSVQEKEGQFGALTVAKIFLVPPLNTTPALPAVVTLNSVDYNIALIKTLRNIKGAVIGYKLVSVGG